MALYGHAVKTAPVAISASETSAILIQGFNKIAIEVPSSVCGIVTATCSIYCKVAMQDTDEFRALKLFGINSGGHNGWLLWEVPSNTGNCFIELNEVAGYNYMKVVFSNSMTAEFNVRVHMSNLHNM